MHPILQDPCFRNQEIWVWVYFRASTAGRSTFLLETERQLNFFQEQNFGRNRRGTVWNGRPRSVQSFQCVNSKDDVWAKEGISKFHCFFFFSRPKLAKQVSLLMNQGLDCKTVQFVYRACSFHSFTILLELCFTLRGMHLCLILNWKGLHLLILYSLKLNSRTINQYLVVYQFKVDGRWIITVRSETWKNYKMSDWIFLEQKTSFPAIFHQTVNPRVCRSKTPPSEQDDESNLV